MKMRRGTLVFGGGVIALLGFVSYYCLVVVVVEKTETSVSAFASTTTKRKKNSLRQLRSLFNFNDNDNNDNGSRTLKATTTATSTTAAAEAESTTTEVVNGETQSTPISYFVKFEGPVLCGGTLIAGDIVLTAAHCVDRAMPPQVRLAPTTKSNGVVVDVDQSAGAIHPLWNGRVTNGGDFALIKLVTPVDLTIYQPVKLNEDCTLPIHGTTLTTYGFGRLEDGGSTSYRLQTLDMNVQSQSSTYSYIAAFATFFQGVCQGDSGGPLVQKGTTIIDDNGGGTSFESSNSPQQTTRKTPDIQYGVVSFGIGGCAKGSWDGFARISESYGWIRTQVCLRSQSVGPYFNCGTRKSLGVAIKDQFRHRVVQNLGATANRISNAIGFGNVAMPYNGEV